MLFFLIYLFLSRLVGPSCPPIKKWNRGGAVFVQQGFVQQGFVRQLLVLVLVLLVLLLLLLLCCC